MKSSQDKNSQQVDSEAVKEKEETSKLPNLVVSLIIVWVGAFLFLLLFYNYAMQFLVDKFIN